MKTKTAEETLKSKGIKDTLFIDSEWVKGGLSELMKEHTQEKLKEREDETIEGVIAFMCGALGKSPDEVKKFYNAYKALNQENEQDNG